MEHMGLQYRLVQTSQPIGWMWTVHLHDGRTKTGTAPNRTAAIRLAEIRIQKAERKRAQSRRSLKPRG